MRFPVALSLAFTTSRLLIYLILSSLGLPLKPWVMPAVATVGIQARLS